MALDCGNISNEGVVKLHRIIQFGEFRKFQKGHNELAQIIMINC